MTYSICVLDMTITLNECQCELYFCTTVDRWYLSLGVRKRVYYVRTSITPHAWRDWIEYSRLHISPGFNCFVEVILFVILRWDNQIQNTACGSQLYKSVNIICNSAISCILLNDIRFILIYCQINCSKWPTSLSIYFFPHFKIKFAIFFAWCLCE